MNVLCVDDDPDALSLYAAMLAALGHTATTCQSPEDALGHYARETFHVAIVDLLMPTMDGRELCRQLRARQDPCGYVTIVVATVLTGRVDYVSAIEAGADDFLSKPLDAAVLRARLLVAERVRTLRLTLAEQARFLAMCMHCRKVRNELGVWQAVEQYLATHGGPDVSHGLCPSCFATNYPEV